MGRFNDAARRIEQCGPAADQFGQTRDDRAHRIERMHATEQPLLIAVHLFHVAMRIIGDAARDSFGDGDERCRQWHCKQG